MNFLIDCKFFCFFSDCIQPAATPIVKKKKTPRKKSPSPKKTPPKRAKSPTPKKTPKRSTSAKAPPKSPAVEYMEHNPYKTFVRALIMVYFIYMCFVQKKPFKEALVEMPVVGPVLEGAVKPKQCEGLGGMYAC